MQTPPIDAPIADKTAYFPPSTDARPATMAA